MGSIRRLLKTGGNSSQEESRPASARAEALYAEYLARHPEDSDAWHDLGEVRFHSGPRRGQPLTRARASFAHVAALDPGNWNGRLHLARDRLGIKPLFVHHRPGRQGVHQRRVGTGLDEVLEHLPDDVPGGRRVLEDRLDERSIRPST